MNQYDYQKELLQKRHPKYYQEFIEREPYEFKIGGVKPIAFYLPQFHNFPENDKWWGKGFTEWTNVTKTMPQFTGHYQPHLVGELGYYNLMMDGVIERQIELAKMYGIYGFCFHFYMFDNHKRLLERPLNKFLANSNLNMPFCLCYANENWTRRWDGMEDNILIAQTYSDSFELDLATEMLKYLQDKRYITIDGKPLIIIYRINILLNPVEFSIKIREECRKLGIGEIYLCSVLSFGMNNAIEYGFDDNIEFPLHGIQNLSIMNEVEIFSDTFNGKIFSYPNVVKTELEKNITFPRFRGVMPSWDNEARKPNNGYIFHGSTPELYRIWLQGICHKTIIERNDSQRFVFINAWNEWAEGAHLEPDRRYGYAYLEATYQALKNHDIEVIDDCDFMNLNSQQMSITSEPKYPENSFMQLLYYQNNEINISDMFMQYFNDDTQTKFIFELDNIENLTHIRIDLTNFPVVANLNHVKLILEDETSHVLLPEFSNANFIEENSYLFLHDDPINIYFISSLGIDRQSIIVEVEVALQPIKKFEILNFSINIINKLNEKLNTIQKNQSKEREIISNLVTFIQIFIDQGNGFTEANSIKLPVEKSIKIQEFIVDLANKPNIKALCIAPLNDSCVIEIENLHIKTKESELNLLPYIKADAIIQQDKRYFFTAKDSQIWFNGLNENILLDAQVLTINIRYSYIGQDALHVSLEQTKMELEQLRTEISVIRNNFYFRVLKKVGLI
jgi:hypothetical protein